MQGEERFDTIFGEERERFPFKDKDKEENKMAKAQTIEQMAENIRKCNGFDTEVLQYNEEGLDNLSVRIYSPSIPRKMKLSEPNTPTVQAIHHIPRYTLAFASVRIRQVRSPAPLSASKNTPRKVINLMIVFVYVVKLSIAAS